jgi:hypothetical protein
VPGLAEHGHNVWDARSTATMYGTREPSRGLWRRWGSSTGGGSPS